MCAGLRALGLIAFAARHRMVTGPRSAISKECPQTPLHPAGRGAAGGPYLISMMQEMSELFGPNPAEHSMLPEGVSNGQTSACAAVVIKAAAASIGMNFIANIHH